MRDLPDNIFGFPIGEWEYDAHQNRWTHWSGIPVGERFVVGFSDEERAKFRIALQRYIDALPPVEREERRARFAVMKEGVQFYCDLHQWMAEHPEIDGKDIPPALMQRFAESQDAVAQWNIWRRSSGIVAVERQKDGIDEIWIEDRSMGRVEDGTTEIGIKECGQKIKYLPSRTYDVDIPGHTLESGTWPHFHLSIDKNGH